MATNEKNHSAMNLGTFAALAEKGRIEIGKALGLTGCEVSFNHKPAGWVSPFQHFHKLNEEVYIVLSGNGVLVVDDETLPLQEGSIVRVAPKGIRAINAGDAGLVYLCIQAQDGSLTQCTGEDGVLAPATEG